MLSASETSAVRRCTMKFASRFVLILAALIAASFLVLAVACGGEEKEKTPTATPTAAATKTPAAGKTPVASPAAGTPEKTPAGEAGELPSIPAYPGAEETLSGTFTGAEGLPFSLTGDVPIGPEEFGPIQYTLYQTSDSPGEVLDFYKKELKGWKEEGTFSMEQLGQGGEVAVWSKDDQNVAAWIAAFGGEGTTSVVVAMGAHQ
jgi:hypothetical protein